MHRLLPQDIRDFTMRPLTALITTLPSRIRAHVKSLGFAGLFILSTTLPLAWAGSTDIASEPLSTTAKPVAKPNVLFILDDSGSMSSDYMPDDMNNTGTYGYKSTQCNGLAYNPDPSVSYAPPLQYDGTSYPNASFTAAWKDGYAGGSTTNLTGNTYYVYTGAQSAMRWTYSTSGVVDTTTTFYKECTSKVGNTPGSAVFTLTTVATADQQRYANWYAYYRTRTLLMRTAAGRAFQALGSDYRVGFSTISDKTANDGTYFLHIRDFDAAQKKNFFTHLYSKGAGSYTPLRGALSKAGQYYANKVPGQDYDPVQYSCQRNYTILSTDGYWNNNIETTTYGPYKLDGTTVGQQDANEVRPMQDGSRTQVTRTIVTQQTYNYPRTRTQTTTTAYTLSKISVGTTLKVGSCSATQYTVTTQPQKRSVVTTQAQVETDSTAQQTFTETIITINGVQQSDNTVPTGSLTTSFSNTWVNNGTPSSTNPSFANNGSSTTSCQTLIQLTAAGTPPGSTTYSPNATGTAGTPSVANSTAQKPASVGSVIGSPTAVSDNSVTTTIGGSTDSLADVAEYYYKTDLRDSSLGNCAGNGGRDVCDNTTLTPIANDSATYQHMTTSTIGIGTNGTLQYDPDYLRQTSGDFFNIKQGTANWPIVLAPSPNAEAIDDLWHAAVNGRGQYFATKNSTTLAQAIQTSLNAVVATVGSSSAAATTSLQPIKGANNQVFIASFTTVEWTGDVKACPLNAIDGTVDTTTINWSAAAQLLNAVPANRKIYYKASGSTALRDFTYANLSIDGYGGYFANFCSQPTVPSQCTVFTAAQVTTANTGSNLVGYLRGVSTLEDTTGANSIFRTRTGLLGDIVDSEPAYVQKPPFAYSDTGYSAFVSTWSTRKAVVFTGSNDGLMHAFSADATDGGTELWAYVPTAVMPSMYQFADKNYANMHSYRTDGTPVVADIYDTVGKAWHTILVAGLNAGGRAYYALDITDTTSPKLLWEYSNSNDADLGLTFGNPVITKRADGTWVVVFASGYNNNTAGGSGVGKLYVLNAYTGARLLKLSTSAGSTTTPSGLAKINAWLDDPTDNTAKLIYGGDMLGNLWRFDLDNRVAPYQSAMLLANLTASGVPQPVSTMPQLATVTSTSGIKYPVVSVGTGRYLGLSDLSDKSLESIYVIKDQLASTGWADLRTGGLAVKEAVTLNGSTGTIGATTLDWATAAGWYADLPASGERIAIDMVVTGGSLVAISAIPGGTDCSPVGSSAIYKLDLAKGTGTVETLGDFLVAGFAVIMVNSSGPGASDGTLKVVGVKGDSTPFTKDDDFVTGSSAGKQHRTSWRELVN
jgi:type IV pilus assembly protein PilY1